MKNAILGYARSIFLFAMSVTLIGGVDANAQATNEKLRSELLQMRQRDQAARDACTKGNADEQIKCLMNTAETVDHPNVKRIAEIISATGFPSAKEVGVDGVKAFFLILQHSDSVELRLKCKKGIERAFKERVLSPSEYTSFVDRLLVKQGKPQIYGSNFESKEGKLVMSKTTDFKNLDKRRISAGLPPIAEYVKMMKEFYNLEVVLLEGK